MTIRTALTALLFTLNSWIAFGDLKNTPSLMVDYRNLAQMQPGNEVYDTNVRRCISNWKKYWGEFIPQMIATRAVPNGETWGKFPQLAAELSSTASMTHNTLTCSFAPGSFKGIVFMAGPEMTKGDQGNNFGPELSALANSWIRDFGGKAKFIHTMPDKALAPAITAPSGIQGEHKAITITDWKDYNGVLDAMPALAK